MMWMATAKYLVPVLALLAVIALAYTTGVHDEEERNDLEEAKYMAMMEKQKSDFLTERAVLLAQLEKNREQANNALDTLLNKPAPRLQNNRCKGTSDRGSDTTGGAGLPDATTERTNDRSLELLNEAAELLKRKSGEWSRALNACTVVKEYYKQHSLKGDAK